MFLDYGRTDEKIESEKHKLITDMEEIFIHG